ELLTDLFDFPRSVETVHNIVQQAVATARACNGRPQGAGPVSAPAAGLGTGIDGGATASGPGVRGPSPAGQPRQGRKDRARGLRAVEAGAVVGGRYGMRKLNDRRGGFSTWPGPARSVPSATAAGVIDGGAPVENPGTSWYTFGCDAPPRNPG